MNKKDLNQTGVYKILNIVNNKVYIGQSVNIRKRWNNHKSIRQSSNLPLYVDMRRYGIDNFEISIIEVCKRADLDAKEKYWISYYDSYNPNIGYNSTSGGHDNGYNTRKLTDIEVREIIDLLKCKTQIQIAKQYNVDQSVISNINLGKSYYFSNISYPINKLEKTIYHCIDCGCEVYYGSTRCSCCDKKYRRQLILGEKNFPSREELKAMIKNTPFTQIGKMYGVSDNAVRKWCVSMNLPVSRSKIKEYTPEQWELI